MRQYQTETKYCLNKTLHLEVVEGYIVVISESTVCLDFSSFWGTQFSKSDH